MKQCTRCLTTKPATLEFFDRRRASPDGLKPVCKPCHRAYEHERSRRPEVIAKTHKRSIEFGARPEAKAYRAKYHKGNKERARAQWKARKAADPKAWQAVAMERQRRYYAKPKNRVSRQIRQGIHRNITKGAKGGRSWQSLVGYTLDDLTRWLESQFLPGMTWENYGRWHIDHMVPIAAFEFTTPECPGFRACWHLANLQPLWGPDNQSKGGRCTHPEIAEALTILARRRKHDT